VHDAAGIAFGDVEELGFCLSELRGDDRAATTMSV
jgi:hypothetical protein